ncbi:YciI family protein [Agaribacterium haliotis]|uniref:YciI family protein n=1 Tax=Agaribacterium haliotis TaxID=2013869 RepID=UPI000BB55BBF|nr:YciI family protein [Agaribacterium haliotis]
MPSYVISYIGGDAPKTEAEGKAHFAKYMKWLNDLGDAALSPANPFKHTHVVNPKAEVSTGSVTKMSGFSVIKADSIEAAIEIAKACPFLDIGGSLEVSELVAMGSDEA